VGTAADRARRNATRSPVLDAVNDRGRPRLNRAVRADARGMSPAASAAARAASLIDMRPHRRVGHPVGWTHIAQSRTAYAERVPDRRLLAVHAHPDDEAVGTGSTLAHYVDAGVGVTVVTCTAGELGEVLVEDLAHLAADRTDRLGEHRQGELADALAILGVSDHRYLGGVGRYRDSGMAGTPANGDPRSFAQADLLAAADDLVVVIREVRPQVMVTYDPRGGYGHPDHIQANRVAHYAAALAAVPSHRPDLGPAWTVSKIYWSALPRSYVEQGMRALVDAGGTRLFGVDRVEDLPFIVEDDAVTTVIDAGDQAERKLAALRAHRTQVSDDGPFFALAELLGPHVLGREFYRLAGGVAVADPGHPLQWETDLFAGIGEPAGAPSGGHP